MAVGAVRDREVNPSRSDDLLTLTKPRITTMVVVTAAMGFFLAADDRTPWLLLIHTLVGTGLVSGGASALNQVLERKTDARMTRTAERPIPAGRLSPDIGLLFGVTLGVVGLVYLALVVNPLTGFLGVAALGSYVFVYTPLKKASSLATLVGAVPGAIPPMMGWAARSGHLDLGAWVLFGILFLWQLPHFLAIAWLCRHDYAQAGFPMLTTADTDGTRTARQMLLYCAALIPFSLLPSVIQLTGAVYFWGTLVLGLGFFVTCIRFSRDRSLATARTVLLASVFYLPAVLIMALMDRAAGP